MPTVPRYGQPRVSEAPLPGVRVSPSAPVSAFAAPASPDLSGLTGAVAQMAADEKRKADQMAFQRADNQLFDLQQELDEKARQRRGVDALGATEEVKNEWQKRAGEITHSLANDTQREAVLQRSEQYFRSLYTGVERYADAQVREADDQETKRSVDNRLSMAVKHYDDPEQVATAVAETKAVLLDYARRNGLGDEARTAMTEKAVSGLHTDVIGQMFAKGQDLLAKKYIDEHRDELSGEDRIKVDATAREGSVRGESQRQADKIMQRGLSRTDALAEARKIDDPDVQDATVQRVNQRFQEMAVAKRERNEATLTEATNIIEQHKSVDAVPPALWTTFSASERAGLRSYARQLAKGEPVETDWAAYYDLKSMASAPETRDAFLRTNLLTYRHKLGDAEFKELTGLQASVRKGDAAAEGKMASLSTRNQIVDRLLRQAHINPNPKPGSDDAGPVADFNRLVDQQIKNIYESTGKQATAEDIWNVAGDLLVKGIVTGSGDGFFHFEKKKRAFELAPGETLDVRAEDVPRAERAMIEAALRRRGIPVTDERIAQLYQQRLTELTGTAPPAQFSTGGGSTF